MRLCTLFLLLLTSCLMAEEELSVPPAPEGRLLDDARLFARDRERLARLSQALQAVTARSGFELYVAVFDSLIGTDVRDQSSRLGEAWLGEKPGAVLVIESDSGKHAIGWNRSADAVTEDGDQVIVLKDKDLAPQDQLEIQSGLESDESLERRSADSTEAFILAFASRVDQGFRAVKENEPERWNVRVLVLGTGLLAAVLLVGLLFGAWIRRSDRKVSERLVFPEVTVGMRLGAPCGGGKISSRSFSVLPRGKA